MFTQKTACQPTVPTSTPPSAGPSAMPTPNMLTQMLIARARRAGLAYMPAMIDQPAEARGKRARRRGGREHREPRQENPPAPEPVRRGAAEDQQAGQHHRVTVEDPLQVRYRGIDDLLLLAAGPGQQSAIR